MSDSNLCVSDLYVGDLYMGWCVCVCDKYNFALVTPHSTNRIVEHQTRRTEFTSIVRVS